MMHRYYLRRQTRRYWMQCAGYAIMSLLVLTYMMVNPYFGANTDIPPSYAGHIQLHEAIHPQCAYPNKETYVFKNRKGVHYLTPGHKNCTLGWEDESTVHNGQNLEDAVIWKRFFADSSPFAHLSSETSMPQHRGVFLELGALDGVTFSNTLILEQCYGWNGVLIEAQPSNAAKLRINRPCTAVIEAVGICSSTHNPPYIRMSREEGTAFDLSVNTQTNIDQVKYDEVPCKPLSKILQHHGVSHIHFMSLDVEGAELKVLETMDWNAVKIDVLMVESDFMNDMLLRGKTTSASMETSRKIQAVRNLVVSQGMKQVPSVLRGMCERDGVATNCMYYSISGSDVFVSPDMYAYDQLLRVVK